MCLGEDIEGDGGGTCSAMVKMGARRKGARHLLSVPFILIFSSQKSVRVLYDLGLGLRVQVMGFEIGI